MEPGAQPRLTEWLRACRGNETQDRLAQDISQVTGWQITRDRYSKYESGSLRIGPTVLAHFVDYWASRGVAGPESFPEPEPPVDLATAIADLVVELRTARKERENSEARLRYLEGAAEILAHAAGVTLPAPPVPPGREG